MSNALPKTASRRASLARALEWCAVAAMALLGLAMFHGHILRSGFTRVPGDLGDTRFNLIVLEHGFRYLRGDAFDRVFWSPAWAFFPHPNALAYSDNFAGNLPLYVPFRMLGFDPTRAFAAWIVVCSLLNFTATLLLARTLGLSTLGAGATATVFAYGMPRWQQLNHIQLLPQFWTPLCFIAVVAAWRSWRSGRVRAAGLWAVGSIGFAVGQLAAGIYLGDFLLLGGLALAVLSAIRLSFDRKARDDLARFVRATGAFWLAGLAGGAALLFPLASAYARAHHELAGRSWGEVVGMLPRVTSYLSAPPNSVVYHGLDRFGAGLPVPFEHTMFAGFAPLCALLWLATAVVRRELPVARWVAIATLVTWGFTCLATLYLGSFHGTPWSLWWFFRWLPGLDALRAVTRVTMFQLLPAGLALGVAVTALQRASRGWQLALAWLLAMAPLAENWSVKPADISRDEIVSRARNVADHIPAGCDVFLWRGPNGDQGYATQLDAMWASMELGKPTVNGYSGNAPPQWPFGESKGVSAASLKAWLAREGKPEVAACLAP